MAVRKTVRIAKILENVNYRNKHSTCVPGIREGWNTMLEEILMDADAYAGYGYYEKKDVPEGCEPGIIRHDDPTDNEFPDETRRFYYKCAGI